MPNGRTTGGILLPKIQTPNIAGALGVGTNRLQNIANLALQQRRTGIAERGMALQETQAANLARQYTAEQQIKAQERRGKALISYNDTKLDLLSKVAKADDPTSFKLVRSHLKDVYPDREESIELMGLWPVEDFDQEFAGQTEFTPEQIDQSNQLARAFRTKYGTLTKAEVGGKPAFVRTVTGKLEPEVVKGVTPPIKEEKWKPKERLRMEARIKAEEQAKVPPFKIGATKERLIGKKARGETWTAGEQAAWDLLSTEDKMIGQAVIQLLSKNDWYQAETDLTKKSQIERETEDVVRKIYGLKEKPKEIPYQFEEEPEGAIGIRYEKPEDVRDAVNIGELSIEEGTRILREQFGFR